MVGSGDSANFEPNALATQLEGVFHAWAQLEPLLPRPQFARGGMAPDAGLPRFGIVQVAGTNVVQLDPTYDDVVAGILLREVISTFFPASCLVDIVYDYINHFCEFLLADPASKGLGPHDPSRWQTLVQTHTRRYVVHYLSSPVMEDLSFAPGSPHMRAEVFRTVLRKFRQFGSFIPPEQVQDIFVAMILPATNTVWEHTYTTEDVEFAYLASRYLVGTTRFPTPTRLARAAEGLTLEACQRAAHRFDEDPFSPTYLYNPPVVGLVVCWVLFETPPSTSIYLARQLTFLPFATLAFAQLAGCPLPTYLNLYLLAPGQLDEFGDHLGVIKKRGVILDYQIFRGDLWADVINFNNSFSVPSKTPAILTYEHDIRPLTRQGPVMPKWCERSWVVQQLLPWFGLRSIMPRALTHFDPVRNYKSFLAVIADAALLSSASLEENLSPVYPLLERFRNVEYVVRLLNIGIALLRYLIDRPESIKQDVTDLGKLGITWQHFPASEWLLGVFRECGGNPTRLAGTLSQMTLAAKSLLFFAPFTIPVEINVKTFIRDKQQEVGRLLREDLDQVPRDEPGRLTYFERLHDQIVADQLVWPRISLSILHALDVEEFHLVVRSPRPFTDIRADFETRLAPHLAAAYLIECHDQAGALVIVGLLKATRAQYSIVRKALVSPNGILGAGASLLANRRIPFWDYTRRAFTETFDLTTGHFAPIGEYLSLLRAEHLARWVPPRKNLPPYARKVLDEPYVGSVEQTPRHTLNEVAITPKIVTGLKESLLSGKPALHNLVERRLGTRWSCDLNWPAYGLERYLLHVFLSTRQPKYIFSHLVTPATRRVLVSAAVSGFQTVILEYLWPKAAPDDKFLQYLYSRTEKNVLAYSVHHVLSDTRFFNLDKIYAQSGAASLDALDLQVFMLARPQGPGVTNFVEYSYGGNVRHAPRSAGWELAADFFGKQSSSTEYPPDSLPTFEIDPRTIGFNEKVALVFRGEFDALPLCLALPFGHYYRTEELFYSSTERLAGQLGHIILFDFPAMRVSQLDTFLDDLLRNPALVAHCNSSLLVEHNLAVTQGVRLGQVNPLRANPYDFVGGHYIHLPKRQLQDGTWHTLSLKEQMNLLKTAWNHTA